MCIVCYTYIAGNKSIDGVEFTRYFFKVGNELIHKIRDRDEKVRQEAQRIEDEKERIEDERQQQREEGVIAEHTKEESDAAMMKLCEKSFLFDAANFIDAVFIQYFRCLLTPFEFKMQLEKSFKLVLTPAELGALVKQYHYDDKRIDGEKFLLSFLALHHTEVEKHRQLWKDTFKTKRILVQKAKTLDRQLYPVALGR